GMMRVVGVVLLAAMVGGCTSVRVLQREGCWVRRTEQWPVHVTEELGPCERPAPAWSEDRLTRLVQECMAQADYRWRNRALEAWNRWEPLPEPEEEERVREACMSEASYTLLLEKEALERRLAEVSTDRDALRARVEKDDEHLRTHSDRLTAALGEAAKKPAGSAMATANSTSDGSATTQSDSSARSPSELVTVPVQPEAVSRPRPVRRSVSKKPAAVPKAGLCEPQRGPPKG
ncbi:MAG TPA: hypothetical protein VLQ93_08990, partial [Myxococcaceae bacterium]|nr:hypothetical protein [Myxococcaceae bacterium]